MKQELLMKRLKAIRKSHKQKYLKYATEELSQSTKRGDWSEQRAIRYKNDSLKSGLSVEYRPRLKIFKDRNVDFDPVSQLGHSYHWYLITKSIKGKLVLNSYHYSSQTTGHYYALRNLFKDLKLKYVTIEAPSGLQDLDSSVNHYLYQIGKETVAMKHSRNPKPYKARIRSLNKELRLAKQLGGKAGSTLKEVILKCEQERRSKLDRLKTRKLERKELEYSNKVIAGSVCDQCKSEVTEVCSKCEGVVCEPCHTGYSFRYGHVVSS
jgi:hypothetical protein